MKDCEPSYHLWLVVVRAWPAALMLVIRNLEQAVRAPVNSRKETAKYL